jgi:uncharacterized cupredoxin-like copper-binding protein
MIIRERSSVQTTFIQRHRRVALACLGLSVVLIGMRIHLALAATTNHSSVRTTVINVIAGKPSELAFKLSKSSNLPSGTVTFKISNAGRAVHAFKICTVLARTAAKNTCVGVATKPLKPGQSATLTIKLTKKGTYEYLCPVPGHAAAGMKGLVGVGVAVKTTASKPPPKHTSSGPCPNGQSIWVASPSGDNDADNSAGGSDDSDGCL